MRAQKLPVLYLKLCHSSPRQGCSPETMSLRPRQGAVRNLLFPLLTKAMSRRWNATLLFGQGRKFACNTLAPEDDRRFGSRLALRKNALRRQLAERLHPGV